MTDSINTYSVEPVTHTDNEQKYDRQLRLWAAAGQQDLEDSHVCLVNATATGCEVLKNLVLPNIGEFTIIDGATVTADDLSSNFFLDDASIGAPRARAAAALVGELNPSVQGHHVTESIEQVLEDLSSAHDPASFWKKFSLIVFTDSVTHHRSLVKVAALVAGEVPVLVANSYGFYGSLQLLGPERTIIQTHEIEVPDLRIDAPWPELARYVDSLEIDTLPVNKIKDIPYAVLLIHFRSKYIQQQGKPPVRQAFKPFLEQDKTVASIRYAGLENVDELLKFSWRACLKTSIPLGVEEILNDSRISSPEELAKLSSSSGSSTRPSPFWVLVAALKKFVQENNGQLPVSGKVIDMASSTEKYLELQNIYRKKAESDKQKIQEYVSQILRKLSLPEAYVSQGLLDNFCKNTQYLTVQKGSLGGLNDKIKQAVTTNDEHSSASIYFAFFVLEKFGYAHQGQFPKTSDLPELISISESLLETKLGTAHIDDLKYIKTLKELIRSQGTEMVNIASFIGGLGGQEALKILTNQYTPLNNTLVFDGIQSSIEKWKL